MTHRAGGHHHDAAALRAGAPRTCGTLGPGPGASVPVISVSDAAGGDHGVPAFFSPMLTSPGVSGTVSPTRERLPDLTADLRDGLHAYTAWQHSARLGTTSGMGEQEASLGRLSCRAPAPNSGVRTSVFTVQRPWRPPTGQSSLPGPL